MRAGFFTSAIAHAGFFLLLMQHGCSHLDAIATQGVVVPIEIVATAPESNVRALAIPEQIPEAEPLPLADEPNIAHPAVATAPAQRPQRPQQQDDFNLDQVASNLRNLDRDPGRQHNTGASAQRNQRGAGLGTAEAVAIDDRVRALTARHMLRCWRMPADLPDPERLQVTVQLELDRNGNLRGQPRVTSPQNYQFDAPMRTAVEYALRAVRACDPYPFPNDPVVGAHYERWSELEYTFRVSDVQ